AKGPPPISRALAQPVGLFAQKNWLKIPQPDHRTLKSGYEVEDLLEPGVPLRCFMMKSAERTSAEAFEKHLPGKLIAASSGRSWKDLLVQVFSRQQAQETILVPAVPEPLFVWILSGTAVVEERELGGAWH